MSFMVPSDFADLRRMSEEAMDQQCVIRRAGAFVNEGGGAGYREPGTELTFPCRIMAVAGGSETIIAERPEALTLVQMTFPLSVTDLRIDDRPIVNGVQYEVVGIPDVSTLSVERHATLRRV